MNLFTQQCILLFDNHFPLPFCDVQCTRTHTDLYMDRWFFFVDVSDCVNIMIYTTPKDLSHLSLVFDVRLHFPNALKQIYKKTIPFTIRPMTDIIMVFFTKCHRSSRIYLSNEIVISVITWRLFVNTVTAIIHPQNRFQLKYMLFDRFQANKVYTLLQVLCNNSSNWTFSSTIHLLLSNFVLHLFSFVQKFSVLSAPKRSKQRKINCWQVYCTSEPNEETEKKNKKPIKCFLCVRQAVGGGGFVSDIF